MTGAVDALRGAESPRRVEIEATLAGGGYAVLVDGPEQAMAVSNLIAPEHSSFAAKSPTDLVPLVRNAGAVFLGPYTPASLGDYIAGPSHTLPTFGSARYASALGVEDFLRRVHVISPAAPESRPSPATLPPSPVPKDSSPTPSRCSLRSGPGKEPGERRKASAAGEAPGARWRCALAITPPRSKSRSGSTPTSRPSRRRGPLSRRSRPSWPRSPQPLPDRQATALCAALAAHHGVEPAQVFCANGSNEAIQCLLLAYGGRDDPPWFSSPPTPFTPTSPA